MARFPARIKSHTVSNSQPFGSCKISKKSKRPGGTSLKSHTPLKLGVPGRSYRLERPLISEKCVTPFYVSETVDYDWSITNPSNRPESKVPGNFFALFLATLRQHVMHGRRSSEDSSPSVMPTGPGEGSVKFKRFKTGPPLVGRRSPDEPLCQSCDSRDPGCLVQKFENFYQRGQVRPTSNSPAVSHRA
jgi:hypothetical protein